MAWTTPMVWIVGHIVTATDLNTNIADNTNFLHSAPAVKALNSGDHTQADSTWTTPILDTLLYDVEGTVYNSSGVFTIATAGVYNLAGGTSWAANSTHSRFCRIIKNLGSVATIEGEQGAPGMADGVVQPVAVSAMGKFSAGDTVEFQVFQNTGSGLNILGASSTIGHWFAITWVSNGS